MYTSAHQLFLSIFFLYFVFFSFTEISEKRKFWHESKHKNFTLARMFFYRTRAVRGEKRMVSIVVNSRASMSFQSVTTEREKMGKGKNFMKEGLIRWTKLNNKMSFLIHFPFRSARCENVEIFFKNTFLKPLKRNVNVMLFKLLILSFPNSSYKGIFQIISHPIRTKDHGSFKPQTCIGFLYYFPISSHVFVVRGLRKKLFLAC